MSLLFGIHNLLNPEHYTWLPVRILHETDKAILVECGAKTWIPKSRIFGIKMRNGVFEIYIEEEIVT